MSDANNINTNPLNKLDPSLLGYPRKEKKSTEIGQQEFLTLLVTQLKNQDPLDPVKNEDFAVNLAQFSQLEQLIQINKNLSSQGGGELGSLASYLGKEVVLGGRQVTVTEGDGGTVSFKLAAPATSVRVELLNEEGTLVETLSLGEQAAGSKQVILQGLQADNGSYAVRVTALGSDGRTLLPEPSVGGMVTGFIPGPNPSLVVAGREISPVEVKEVRMTFED